MFINVATYMIFTVACFFIARPPPRVMEVVNRNVADSRLGRRLPAILRRMVTVKQMSKEQTVAICFCGAAKTTSLGIPLVSAMWKQADDLTRAYVQIPVLLYTIEQVFLAQMLVYFFKWYLRRDEKAAVADEETTARSSTTAPGSEPHISKEEGEGIGNFRESATEIDGGQNQKLHA